MVALAAILTGLAVLLALWPIGRARAMGPMAIRQRRMQAAWGRKQGLLHALGPYVGLEAADTVCLHAGRPGGITGAALLQIQWLAALVFTVVLGAAGTTLGIIGGVSAWYMPRIILSGIAGQRRAQIAIELPAFLDLWGLLVSSGEGVETALVEICKRHPDWLLSVEVRRAVDRMLASGLFADSLREEAKVTGSLEFQHVAEQIGHLSEGGGVPSKELARMAAEMREQRIADLAQSAGTMAVIGIFPKLFGIFLSLMPVIATIVLTVQRQM